MYSPAHGPPTMIEPRTYLLFSIGVMALIAAPGPDFFYVLTRATAQGPRAGVLGALGIATGLTIHTAAAATGLSALIAGSPLLFRIVKYAGAAYLVYIGLRMILAETGPAAEAGAAADPPRVVYRQGMLTNLLNPKVALTFLAFLPQFLNPRANHALQALTLGATICVLSVAWFSFVAAGAGALRRGVLERPRIRITLQRVLGVILIGLGAKLALPL